MEDKLQIRLQFTVRFLELAADLQSAQLNVWKRYIAIEERGAAQPSAEVPFGPWSVTQAQIKFMDSRFELDLSDKYVFEVQGASMTATATVFSKDIARTEVVTIPLKTGEETVGMLEVQTTSGLTSELVYLKIKGVNLEDMDSFSKSDPFFTISAPDAQGLMQVIYRSETIPDNLDPVWRGFFLYRHSIEQDGIELPVTIQVFDEDTATSQDFIGEFQTKMSELLNPSGYIVLRRPSDGPKGAIRGRLQIQRSFLAPNKTLIDYMRAGLDFHLSVIIDFSDRNARRALHSTESSSPYLSALEYLSWFFKNFDSNGRYDMYGFGARFKKTEDVSHCFPIERADRTPEESKGPAEAESILGPEGVKNAYISRLSTLELFHPTYVHPVMRHLLKPFETPRMAREGGRVQYHIFVILTQGEFDDFEEFKEQIVRASMQPISVILVGLGENGFPQLSTADSDRSLMKTQKGNVEERDIVQRVIYSNYRGNDRAFVNEAFAEIPRQVHEFMMANKLA